MRTKTPRSVPGTEPQLDLFLELLRKSGVLEPFQLQEVVECLAPGMPALRTLCAELIRRGWLTPYQVNQLALGRPEALVIGQYLLLERLGCGGMGQVFKARHARMKRLAAVKLIRRDHFSRSNTRQRFQREIQLIARLCHPNIVHALDADEANGCYYLAMEYIDGPDLSQVLERNGRLPVGLACEYAGQAALGLAYAHGLGLVHRDIKPSNLMILAQQNRVKLLDFGLSRLAWDEESVDGGQDLTRPGRMLGTTDYLAPEQAVDARAADARADLYSLGCTLYELLSGQVPFPGGTKMEKLLRHLREKAQRVDEVRPDVPPQVAAVVRRLMRKRPDRRYQTAAEAAEALAAVIGTLSQDVCATQSHRCVDTSSFNVPVVLSALKTSHPTTDPGAD